jgi:hypothetical protein
MRYLSLWIFSIAPHRLKLAELYPTIPQLLARKVYSSKHFHMLKIIFGKTGIIHAVLQTAYRRVFLSYKEPKIGI